MLLGPTTSQVKLGSIVVALGKEGMLRMPVQLCMLTRDTP